MFSLLSDALKKIKVRSFDRTMCPAKSQLASSFAALASVHVALANAVDVVAL